MIIGHKEQISFNGELPRIGIRPVVDGRRNGVRESLEEQTMGMAKRVVVLIESTLLYPSGEKVECIILDTTIDGAAKVARCEVKFKKENVGISITVTPCWCYGTETIDQNPHRVKVIWGFNGTERLGDVFLAAVGHDQIGLPVCTI